MQRIEQNPQFKRLIKFVLNNPHLLDEKVVRFADGQKTASKLFYKKTIKAIIKSYLFKGRTQLYLAKKYGVSKSLIHQILYRKVYKQFDVEEEIPNYWELLNERAKKVRA